MSKANTIILTKVERPNPPHLFSAVNTFMWRTMQQVKHNWVALSIGDVMMPVVFMLIFTYFFGGAISGSPQQYLQYLLPGIMLMTVVPMTLNVGAAISTDISKGVFDRFRTLPFPQSASLLGALLVYVLRYITALLVLVGTGFLLGFRADLGGIALAMALVVLFAFCISWAFAAVGVLAKKPELVLTSASMIVYPLLFASNIFVDVRTMPGWLQAVIAVNPVSVVTTSARQLVQGTVQFAGIGLALGVCAACLLVFMPLALTLYNKKK